MSRIVFLIIGLAFLLPTGALPRSNSQTVIPRHEEEMMRQVLELETQAKEAALHNDVSFAGRTLADDYVAIGPLGNVITKNESMLARRQGKLHYDSIDISEMVVRIYGDTAIVTAKAVVKGSNVGEDFSGPYRFTRVWVKRNGQWQAVSYQATVTQ
jgi:ketosteroid isomerase-like protein